MRTTYKQEQERDDDEYDYGDNVDKMVIIRIMVVLYDENDENWFYDNPLKNQRHYLANISWLLDTTNDTIFKKVSI